MRKSSELKVGDIVIVNPNERIPADMILLYTKEESGTVFIRTDQLDGETDWKLRKPINLTQTRVYGSKDFKEFLGMNYSIKASRPTNEIYKFEGVFKDRTNKTKESLNLEQSLWANCVLASAKIIGKKKKLQFNYIIKRNRHIHRQRNPNANELSKAKNQNGSTGHFPKLPL